MPAPPYSFGQCGAIHPCLPTAAPQSFSAVDVSSSSGASNDETPLSFGGRLPLMKVRTCVRKLASSGVSRNSMGGSLLGRRKLFQRLDLTPRTRRHGDTLGAWRRAGTKPRSYVDQSVGADDDYGV